MGSRGGISGSKRTSARSPMSRGAAYILVLEPLYNGEGSRIMHILHDNPVHSLLVFAVNSGSLNELRLDALDAVGLLVGVKVDGECIDHFVSCGVLKRFWMCE